MRGLGKGMKEFKKAQADLEDEFHKAVEAPEPPKKPLETTAEKSEEKDTVSNK